MRATVDLARHLGLKVVAEGIETQAVLERLAALGCDSAQGFLISRPLPSGELAALLGARVGGTPDGAAASSRNGRLAVVDAV